MKNNNNIATLRSEKMFEKNNEERRILKLLQSGRYCYPKITEIAKN